MAVAKQTIARPGLLLLFLISFLIGIVSPVLADTPVGGVIDTDTVWTAAGSPYIVTNHVTIRYGKTLTIEPGVVVHVGTGLNIIVEYGSIRALGSSSKPIIITSEKDVSGGTPNPGDWGQIRFFDGTNDADTLFEYVDLRYGQGLLMQSASPTLNHVTIGYMSGPAITIDLDSFPAGTGNRAVNNALDAILVPPGDMLSSGTWGLLGIPYFIEGVVSVGQSPQITGISPVSMEQGVTVDALIVGKRLSGAESIAFSGTGVHGEILPGGTDTTLPVRISVSDDAVMDVRTFNLQVAAGLVHSSPLSISIGTASPVITAINPSNIFVNRPPVDVELSGKFYNTQSVILLKGTELLTTFIDDKHLRTTIPRQGIAGIQNLQVRNPDPVNAGGYLYSNLFPIAVELPKFTFTPDTLTIRQGEGGTLNLTIPFVAPAGGITANLTSTDPSAVTVPASVSIPEGASITDVHVTALNTGGTRDQIIEVHANQLNWSGGKVTITVRPPPTINLIPTSILTGQGYSVFLTISLTDPAPPGGLEVILSATPSDIVSHPAKVTIPAGTNQSQITVTAASVGTTTISASSPDSGFVTGDTTVITVRPVATFDVGPVVSPQVGVMLAAQPPPSPATNYGPLKSVPVGVAFGSVVTGINPDRGSIGTQGLLLRVNGQGLSTVTDFSIIPPDGITIQEGSLFAVSDGSYVEVVIDIAADSVVGDRTVVVSTPSGAVKPVTAGVNIFRVTNPPPYIQSLLPNFGVQGTTSTLQINGRNLKEATMVEFIPPDGISVGNPPSVNSDGTVATVNVGIAPTATTGKRVVRITTPGGSTGDMPTAANSFDVRSTPGTTYTPLLSAPVGVLLESPAQPLVPRTYSPIESVTVGVALGAVITDIIPGSGATGASNLLVQVYGSGIGAATAIAFVPSEGITIKDGSFTASSDGTSVSVSIDIATDAPLGERTVLVDTPSGAAKPASPGANQFRITLPQPEILGMQPIRKEVGSTFTLTFHGKNLASATPVEFKPSTGIAVGNPPGVNAEGTLATVQVTIASDAPVGNRVVTITTPGGTTFETPTASNTFTVTATPGVTYEPLVSPLVGVAIQAEPSPEEKTYGPIVSEDVGVYITPPPSPGPQSTYGPVVSVPVGVSLGATITGISPKSLSPGSAANMTLYGTGLDQINGIDVRPADGITVGTWSISPDGLSATITVAAASDATKGPRSIIPLTSSGPVRPATAMSNVISVGSPPSIISIDPILRPVGTAFTLTIHGQNLGEATWVRFEPPDGILVGNPPVVDGTGTQATVDVVIEGTAQGGQRVVIVTTPYGSSTNIASAANTFTVVRETAGNILHVADRGEESSITLPPSFTGCGGNRDEAGDRLILTTVNMAVLSSSGGNSGGHNDLTHLKRCLSQPDCYFNKVYNLEEIRVSSSLCSMSFLERGPPVAILLKFSDDES